MIETFDEFDDCFAHEMLMTKAKAIASLEEADIEG